MHTLLKKILCAALFNALLIVPQAAGSLSDAYCTSLKTIRATSCVDALVSAGLLATDADKIAHTLALARAVIITAMSHAIITPKKPAASPLQKGDWLTIGSCIAKNVVKASLPLIKNESAHMGAYVATMLLELGSMGHTGYYLLDEKTNLERYYLACLACLGVQGFLQGASLQQPLPQESVALSSLFKDFKDNPRQKQRRSYPERILEAKDVNTLSKYTAEDFENILHRDIAKASELSESSIDFSTLSKHEACTICCDNKTDDWIFTLNESRSEIASFCHVSCLARSFATQVTPQTQEVPQADTSAEQRAELKEMIRSNLRSNLRRQPTEIEIQNAMQMMCRSADIPGKLPSDPFSRSLIRDTWQNYFIYPRA